MKYHFNLFLLDFGGILGTFYFQYSITIRVTVNCVLIGGGCVPGDLDSWTQRIV